MLKKPAEILGWILLSLFVFWFAAMVFTNNTCTRVYRTGWPVWYSFELVETVSHNWTDNESKFFLMKYKVKATLATQRFFQTTIYGTSITCKL
jgi:hypothetical protein